MRAPGPRRPIGNSRLVCVGLAALALGAVAAPGASAHVGVPKSVVEAGPYRLVISGGPVAVPGGAALEFRSRISERVSGAPVEGRSSASVSERSRSGTLLGVYRLSGADGNYFSLLPIPSADGWRSLRFTIRVRGPLGVFAGLYVPPDLFDEWLLEPALLAAAGVAAALFLQGFVRLRRRGRSDHASLGRLGLFGLGLVLMLGPLISPLDPVGDTYLLSAHMLQHVLIGDAGPALILVALRGPLLFFVLPARLMRALGHSSALRTAAAWLSRPRIALGGWALAYGGWHVPAAYDYALAHQWAHDLEHACFITAGFLVWSLLIDPARRGELSRARRLALAAGVFAMGTVIADILIFSLHPLYPAYAGQAERVFGLSPLRDQQLAGLVMTIEQILTLGTFAALTLAPLLRLRRRRAEFGAGVERLA